MCREANMSVHECKCLLPSQPCVCFAHTSHTHTYTCICISHIYIYIWERVSVLAKAVILTILKFLPQLTAPILTTTLSRMDRFPCHQVHFHHSLLHTQVAVMTNLKSSNPFLQDLFPIRYLRWWPFHQVHLKTKKALCRLSAPSVTESALSVCVYARICAASDSHDNARPSETTWMPAWTGVLNPGEGLCKS